jgi:hypothetical protein
MIQPTVSRFVKGIEYKSLTGLLKDFRQQLERDAGANVNDLELNSALLLNDLCAFLGLGDKQRREVLGKSAAFVDALLNSSIDPAIKH